MGRRGNGASRREGASRGSDLGGSVQDTVASLVALLTALYPNLRWWDADTGVATSGANVTSWTDRVNGEAVTPPGTAPTYGAWWGEGRNALAFPLAGAPLTNASSALAAALGGTAKSTVVTLAEQLAWDGTNFSTIFAATGGTVSRLEIMLGTLGSQTTAYRTPGGTLVAAGPQGQRVRGTGYDGSAMKSIHGSTTATTTAATTTTALTRATIGGSYQSSAFINPFAGLIRHVIVVPGVYLPTEQPALWARLRAALEAETTKLRVVAGRGMIPDRLSGTTITRAESRIRCFTRNAATGVRLVLPWYYLAPNYTKPSASGTLTAGIEYNGVFYPATFRGASSRVVAPTDQLVTTDAIVDLPANATFYVRCGAQVTLGQALPVGFERINSAYSAHDQSVLTNGGASQVSGTGAMSETGSYSAGVSYAPVAILGVPAAPQPQCIIVGDSIVRSNDWDGEPSSNCIGWLQRGLFTGGRVPFISYDKGGSTIANFGMSTYPHAGILAQWSQSRALVCLGRNSFSAGLATCQTQMSDVITNLRAAGCEVYACLAPPETTSTDSWATTANQTIVATGTTRSQFNAWLLTLVGSTLAGVVDALAVIESPTAVGKWVPGTTADGIHPAIAGIGNDTVNDQMAPYVAAIVSTW